MENVLKARITADVSNLRQGLSEAERSLNSYAQRIERVQQGIAKSDRQTKEFETQLKKLNDSFKAGVVSQNEYDRAATRLKNNIAESRNETRIWQTELQRLQKAFQDTKTSIDQIPSDPMGQLPETIGATKMELRSANNAALSLVRSFSSGNISAQGFARSLLTISTSASRASTSLGGLANVGRAVLTSLITPANLVVLGITAVTAAFALYRNKTAEAEQETKKLKKSQDDFNESLKDTDQILKAGLYNEILKEIGFLKQEITPFGKIFVDAGLSAEEAFEKLGDRLKKSTKPELEALDSFLRQRYQESLRLSANATTELEKTLANTNAQKYKEQISLVAQQLAFYKINADGAKKSTDTLNKAISDYFEKISAISDKDIFERLNKNAQEAAKTIKDIPVSIEFIPENVIISDGIIQQLQAKIESIQKLREVATDPSRIQQYNQELKVLENQLKTFNQMGVDSANETKSAAEQITSAFSGMAFQISSAFDISDRSLWAFIGTLISNTPKIIAAMMQRAAAAKIAADITTAANMQEASGDAIATATKSAKGLGPVGLAALPVFISAALLLVSRAFGRGAGAGTASASTGAMGGQSVNITNAPRREFGGPVSAGRAYIVGERRPEVFVPSQAGTIIPRVSNMAMPMSGNRGEKMQVDVNIKGVAFGEDILFTVEQAQIKKGLR